MASTAMTFAIDGSCARKTSDWPKDKMKIAAAAATAAALGVLTPMPCIPVIPGPWLPTKPTVLVDNMPILTNASKCFCAYAGVISITSPGSAATVQA